MFACVVQGCAHANVLHAQASLAVAVVVVVGGGGGGDTVALVVIAAVVFVDVHTGYRNVHLCKQSGCCIPN